MTEIMTAMKYIYFLYRLLVFTFFIYSRSQRSGPLQPLKRHTNLPYNSQFT